MQKTIKEIKALINSSKKIEGALVILAHSENNISILSKGFTGKGLVSLAKDIKDQGLLLIKEETLVNKKEKASKKKN